MSRIALLISFPHANMSRKGYDSTQSPLRLFKQILILQVIYYVMAVVLICFSYLVGGEKVSFKTILSWEPIRFDTTWGWTLCMLWLLDTFFSVLAMTFIVGRSKLALDFTLTLHTINIFVMWAVSGSFPTSLMWWILQAVSIVLMVSLGTWTSQWRELRMTFFDESEMGPVNYHPVQNTPTSNSRPLHDSPIPQAS